MGPLGLNPIHQRAQFENRDLTLSFCFCFCFFFVRSQNYVFLLKIVYKEKKYKNSTKENCIYMK